MHVTNPACASCHKFIDPIGFGLEAFDAIGRQREKETLVVRHPGQTRSQTVELELDLSASISGKSESNFSSPKELGHFLARDVSCQKCIVKQLFRYAFGRLETAGDARTIEESFQDFQDSGFRFRELIVSLVKSRQFRENLD
jgi:hypothetical protein